MCILIARTFTALCTERWHQRFEGRATLWRNGKLPRIECSITFLPYAEGGRSSPPQFIPIWSLETLAIDMQ
jgi:hypothetical protein